MKKHRKFFAVFAGIMIIGGIVFCQFVYGQKKINAETIKEQFGYEDASLMPAYNLKQEQKLVFDFELDYQYMENYEIHAGEMISIHTDISCSEESEVICYTWDSEREGKTRITIAPVAPVLANDSLEDESFQTENWLLDDREDYKTLWGCAPIYYICIHYDTKADYPIKLDPPQIIPFTVASESEVPNVEGIVDNYGNLTLSWEPVEGAEYYTVYQYVSHDSGVGYYNEENKGMKTGYHDGSFWSLEQTTETYFSDFVGESRYSVVTEGEKGRRNGSYLGKPLSNLSFQNRGAYGCFFVTATVDGKESNLSAPVDTGNLKLPYRLTDWEYFYLECNSVEEFPEKLSILNIDGSEMQRPVYYRLNRRGSLYAVYDYQIKGTLLGGSIFVEIDEGTELPLVINHSINTVYLTMNSQLNKVPSMAVKSILAQDDTVEGGASLYSLIQERTAEQVSEGNKETVKVPDERFSVFADSAEEVWLAYGLMAGEEEISLKAFPRLQNPYVLEEIFLKVCQQNPYILGVRTYSYDYENACLRVGYSYSKMEIARKQTKIYKQAAELVEQLTGGNMSEEEKEMAFYLWLEENCSYASVEWEQAKKQNFLKTETNSYMENATNAYGALVEREALCQGYASAFQLLSHMAGLHVKTVSGYLNGNIPHAWNVVELDGNWYQVDCSNNKNTVFVPFYLYNGDLEFAESNGYVFGKYFLTDEEREELEKYNLDDSKEFYGYYELTAADMEDVERILEKEVHQEVIVFRYTGVHFNEEELIGMVRRVFLKNGEDERLAGLQYRHINEYIVIYEKKLQ